MLFDRQSKLSLEEKVVLSLKQQNRLHATNGATSYDPQRLVIIAGNLYKLIITGIQNTVNEYYLLYNLYL